MSALVSGTAVAVLAVGGLAAGFIVESSSSTHVRPAVVHREPPGPAQIELAGPGPDPRTNIQGNSPPDEDEFGEIVSVSEVCGTGDEAPALDAVLCALGSHGRHLLADIYLGP